MSGELNGKSDIIRIKVCLDDTVSQLFDYPRVTGYFSIDHKRNIHHDTSQMKYYVPLHPSPENPLDLNIGYENTISREYEMPISEKMDQLLKWIAEHKFYPIDRSGSRIVTQRGTLRKIMCTPYQVKANRLIICATRFQNTIYLCSIDSCRKIAESQNADETTRRETSYGHKFEQWMTSDRPWGKYNLSSTTHELEEFCVVLETQCGNHSLLYKCEIDGIDSFRASVHDPWNPAAFVELKTIKGNERNPSDHQIGYVPLKPYKAPIWWAQAFVSGIPKIVCGIRDERGLVSYIKEYEIEGLKMETCDLLKWDPNVCLNFLNSFLSTVKEIVVEDNYRTVFKFDFNGKKRIAYRKCDNAEDRFRIIPDWYAHMYAMNESERARTDRLAVNYYLHPEMVHPYMKTRKPRKRRKIEQTAFKYPPTQNDVRDMDENRQEAQSFAGPSRESEFLSVNSWSSRKIPSSRNRKKCQNKKRSNDQIRTQDSVIQSSQVYGALNEDLQNASRF